MIELSDQQIEAVGKPAGRPTTLLDPRTNETFVLLRIEEYERLKLSIPDECFRLRHAVVPG